MHPADQYASSTKCMKPEYCGDWTEDQIQEVRFVYQAMLLECDAILGELLGALKETGLDETTQIVYWSDHGELAMEHRSWYKEQLFDGSSRVPLVWSGPGIKKGVKINRPTSLLDVYPTVMDLAGMAHPSGSQSLDGHSLYPDITGNGQPTHPGIAYAMSHTDHLPVGSYLVRWEDAVLFWYEGMEQQVQLFNLTTDPDQMHSIHAEQPALLQKMIGLLQDEFNTTAINDMAIAWDALQYRTFVNYSGSSYPDNLNASSLRWHKFYSQDPAKYLTMINKWLQANPASQLADGHDAAAAAAPTRDEYGVSNAAHMRVFESNRLSLDGAGANTLPDCSGGRAGSPQAAARLAAQLAVVRPEVRDGDCGGLGADSYWDWDN